MNSLLLISTLLVAVHSQTNNFCPNDWIANEDRCYQFNIYPPRKYDDASRFCQTNGAALVSVTSMEEHQFLSARLAAIDKFKYDWYTSGERDPSRKNPRYVWTAIDREVPLFAAFWKNPVEPLNQDITRDLLTYSYDIQRVQYSIATMANREQKRPFVCEISRFEVYRINAQKRGFDYGVPTQDLNKVPRGPKFLIEASSTVVLMEKSSRSVFMECLAVAIPQPEYEWLRNSTGVINSQVDNRYTVSNGKLSIDYPTDQKDTGTYQCKVKNPAGVIISSFAQLSFATLGYFSPVQTGGVFPKYGYGALVECPPITSSLAGAISFQWMKSYTQDGFLDSEYIRPELNSYIFVSSNGKLYFSEVTEADHAYYRCIATLTTSNIYMNYISTEGTQSRTSRAIRLQTQGSTGGVYNAEIQDSFIYVYPPAPVVGMNISLECFAYGTPPLRYSWVAHGWDGARYSLNDHDRVLKINNVQHDDTGKFTCTVSNNVGSAPSTKSYTLYVESKPYFVMPLHDQHLDTGTQQLTWQCEARSVPFPTYTWYKDGLIITNSSEGDIRVHKNTLYLQNLDPKRDSGMYQCFAANSHGVSTTAAQLRILTVKPTFDKFPMSPTVSGAIKGRVVIPCRPEAAPYPEFTWTHNGGVISPAENLEGGRIYRNIEGDLVITELQASDAGTYECKVVNTLGEARNRTTLNIYSQTVISQPPQETKVVSVNSTAFFYCQASFSGDNLDIMYMWLFNDRIINITHNYHYARGKDNNQGGLYIIDAQYWHQGIYTCKATTQVDSASAIAVLKVAGPPSAPSGVAAYSKMSTLQFPSGAIGETVTVNNHDALLRWTEPIDNHGADVISYIIYGKTNYSDQWDTLAQYVPQEQTIIPGLADSQRRQYHLKNLLPGVSYEFKVRAVNYNGVGEDSGKSTKVTIGAAPPRRIPSRIGGGGGSVGTLRITWDPLHPEEQGGWGIGYEVEYRRKPPPGNENANFKWTKEVVHGNVGEFSNEVGEDNYFLPYQVKVTPFNMMGLGPTGENDTVMSAEAMPNGIPGEIYAEPFNESALIVRWVPVTDSREVVKGKLKGYKIHYWLKDIQTQSVAQQNIIYGQTDHGMIIGLLPDTWYTVTVMVFNDAGNGVKGEKAYQSTDRYAPLHYPVHIRVYPSSVNSVKVKFRGVSTGVLEEPLLGYKVKYWRETEDIRNAVIVDLERNVEGELFEIQTNTLYHLRVLGYSVGGEGKGSSPETLFSLMDRGRVMQVMVDPTTSDVQYILYRMEDAATPLFSMFTIVMAVFCAIFALLV
ncbi:contactin-like [Mya arenaria]|uniref:contactin-like n=1 Tax=Mya arenaria TaxID=6604 RepID=UPI0022E955F5|nr:contactin-like [Mya arenaria]